MAQSGAKSVSGVDISDVSVSNATALSKDHEVSDVCNFMQMDAEKMTFEDNSFDVVQALTRNRIPVTVNFHMTKRASYPPCAEDVYKH